MCSEHRDVRKHILEKSEEFQLSRDICHRVNVSMFVLSPHRSPVSHVSTLTGSDEIYFLRSSSKHTKKSQSEPSQLSVC